MNEKFDKVFTAIDNLNRRFKTVERLCRQEIDLDSLKDDVRSELDDVIDNALDNIDWSFDPGDDETGDIGSLEDAIDELMQEIRDTAKDDDDNEIHEKLVKLVQRMEPVHPATVNDCLVLIGGYLEEVCNMKTALQKLHDRNSTVFMKLIGTIEVYTGHTCNDPTIEDCIETLRELVEDYVVDKQLIKTITLTMKEDLFNSGDKTPAEYINHLREELSAVRQEVELLVKDREEIRKILDR